MHGILDDDIRHGVTNAIAVITSAAQPDFAMVIGPDRPGQLLENGVLADDDQRLRDSCHACTSQVPEDDHTEAR